ncbi:uncharacterized protein LOC143143890 isoform X2 [Ptiloglossa arizonensis]
MKMEDFIPTRVSKVKKDAAEEFVSITYESRKRKTKELVHLGKGEENNDKEEKSAEDKYMDRKKKQELEMKRVRYEVMKFGMSGFEKAKADKAKIELAVSLGAKAPRNKEMNYKALKNMRAMQKEMQKNEEHVSGLERSMVKHKTTKTRKRKSAGILEVYGKVSKNQASKKKR